jgi:protocatechuate 3,4-dioxygenase beta subunit
MNRKIISAVFGLLMVAVTGANSVLAQGGGESGFFKDPNATDNHCGFTDETTSGPYYVSGAPVTDNLVLQAIAGDEIVFSGVVYDGSTGEPIPNAQVEVWHADSNGVYYPQAQGDAANFAADALNLRGTVLADETGTYQFTTIQPGIYENRRRHVHWYITAKGYLPLFTQTYWTDDPNVAIDNTDGNTEACRVLTFAENADGQMSTTFNIYLRPDSASPAVVAAPEFTLLNLNTATKDDFLTIPGVGDRMVREFMEYRPYISIVQFRREIGKYVDDSQVAAYEAYVYVPVNVNESDADTLQQIPGVDETLATTLIAARPYVSNQAFLDKLAASLSAAEVQVAANYLEAE